MTFVLLRVSDDLLSFAYLESLEDGLFIILTALFLHRLIRQSDSRMQQHIRQSCELVKFLPIAIGLYVGDRLVYANAAGLDLLKKSSLQDISETPLFEMLTTDNILATQTRINQIEQGYSVPFEDRQLKLSDGSTRIAEVAGIPFLFQGKPAALLVANDITVRKQLEDERMQMYEVLEQRVEDRTYELERRQKAAEGFSSTMAKLNSNLPLDEILTHIMTQTSQILGASASAIYRLNESREMLTLQAAAGLSIEGASIPVGESIVGKAIAHQQLLTSTKTTGAIPQTTLVVPLVIKGVMYGGLLLYFLGAYEISPNDIEIATASSNQIALAIENASLLAEVEETSALAERNRLAHDLHDSVSQVLFSASLIAEVLPQIWELDQSEGLKRLHELRQLTRGAVAELRTLLHELRPATLEEVPLSDLVRHLVEATMGRASIPIDLVIDSQVELPTPIRVTLYRITQQALDNIFRHAKASQASVSLRSNSDYVELQVKDNGCGFDPAKVGPGRLGLDIMRERAAAINASLDIRSHLGDGTTVIVHCIIDNSEVSDD